MCYYNLIIFKLVVLQCEEIGNFPYEHLTISRVSLVKYLVIKTIKTGKVKWDGIGRQVGCFAITWHKSSSDTSRTGRTLRWDHSIRHNTSHWYCNCASLHNYWWVTSPCARADLRIYVGRIRVGCRHRSQQISGQRALRCTHSSGYSSHNTLSRWRITINM